MLIFSFLAILFFRKKKMRDVEKKVKWCIEGNTWWWFTYVGKSLGSLEAEVKIFQVLPHAHFDCLQHCCPIGSLYIHFCATLYSTWAKDGSGKFLGPITRHRDIGAADKNDKVSKFSLTPWRQTVLRFSYSYFCFIFYLLLFVFLLLLFCFSHIYNLYHCYFSFDISILHLSIPFSLYFIYFFFFSTFFIIFYLLRL